MSLPEESKLLRDAIGNKSLRVELDNLWQSAMEKLQELQKGASGQGIFHCLRVESNIWSLIHEDIKKFRPLDLFILSASAALHDIGKINGGAKDEDHGLIARERLLKDDTWKGLFRDKRKAEAVGYVISVHNSGDINLLPEEFIVGNPPGILLRSLSSIFRLADMLDTDFRRCPYLAKTFKEFNFQKKSRSGLPEVQLVAGPFRQIARQFYCIFQVATKKKE